MKGFSLISLLKKKSKKIKKQNLAEIIFLLGIFALPLQICTIISQPDIYLSGQANQFNNATLYLTDIFIILSAVIFFPFKKDIKIKEKLTFAVLLILAGITVYGAAYESSWIAFKIMIALIVYLLIKNEITNPNKIKKTFLISAAFQGIIGVGQFITQESIGLSILGEPNLSSAGISKIDIGDNQVIRSYGTMPHPNILGGFLSIAIILNAKTKKHIPLIAICLAAMIFTFSRSAILSFLTATLIFGIFNARKNIKFTKKHIGLVIMFALVILITAPYLKAHFLSTTEIEERISQISPAIEMILENPLGVGFANFTNNVQEYTETKLAPWEYQPVHNVYLLTTAELGVIGIGILLFLLFHSVLSGKDKSIKYTMLALALIGLVDHYMYTLYQGQMLAVILLAMQDTTPGSPDDHE